MRTENCNTSGINHEFAIEKYKANFEYIKHIEEIRLKQTQIYLIVISTLLGVISFLFTNSDSIELSDTLNRGFPFIAFICVFLTLYGALLCIFFSFQKRNYDYYRRQNEEIELQMNFKSKYPDHKINKNSFFKIITSAFFYWYLLPVILSIVPLTSVVIIDLTYDISISNIMGVELLFKISPLITFFILILIFILMRKNESNSNDQKKS